MNVDTMRAIDRWIGSPLCFLLTLLVRIVPAFRAGPAKPRNVLFIELSEMGSTILADPAMQKARRVLDAELFFVIFKRNVESLDFLRTIDRSRTFTIRNDNFLVLAIDAFRFLLWTRANNIDTTIDLELFSRVTALLSGLSGASRRVGFYRFHNEGLYRGELLTHRVAYNPHIHISKNFIALINALSATQPEVPYSKTVIGDDEIVLRKATVERAAGDDMRERVRKICPAYQPDRHRIVLLNPNASELLPQRRWPRDRFSALAAMILAEWDDTLILLTGAPGEKMEAGQLAQAIGHSRVVNFAGQVTLAELLPLYSISEVMVTNDSGANHFASVTDLPIIALFGPETPALYGSLGNSEAIYAGLACSPCVSAANHRRTACRDPVCMQAIHPEQVMKSVRRILAPATAEGPAH